MKKLTKNLIAFVLTLAMLVGTMSTTSYAATSDEGDIITVTNGKTFTLREEYYKLLISHPLYGTKDYIIYPWEGNLFVWFFNDDLTDVKFSMWDRGTNNFGLYPSKNVAFTEYVYNKDTLEFIQSRDRTINTSNAYNYSYDFMASFNIYTDKTYSSYFYEIKDSEGNNDEALVTFEPLQPKDANEFLRFIANAKPLVDMEDKLLEYYSFLTGEIQDPEEELRIKVSFLTYLYYCLDAQLAQSNERIDMGTTFLINWIGENNDTSNIIYSEVKDSLVDSLKDAIAEGISIPSMEIAGLNIATAIMDYGDVFIVSLGSIDAIRTKDEIQYLMLYKKVLEARASNDEIAIMTVELELDTFVLNMGLGGNLEEMEKFAAYIFNIEQSL